MYKHCRYIAELMHYKVEFHCLLLETEENIARLPPGAYVSELHITKHGATAPFHGTSHYSYSRPNVYVPQYSSSSGHTTGNNSAESSLGNDDVRIPMLSSLSAGVDALLHDAAAKLAPTSHLTFPPGVGALVANSSFCPGRLAPSTGGLIPPHPGIPYPASARTNAGIGAGVSQFATQPKQRKVTAPRVPKPRPAAAGTGVVGCAAMTSGIPASVGGVSSISAARQVHTAPAARVAAPKATKGALSPSQPPSRQQRTDEGESGRREAAEVLLSLLGSGWEARHGGADASMLAPDVVVGNSALREGPVPQVPAAGSTMVRQVSASPTKTLLGGTATTHQWQHKESAAQPQRTARLQDGRETDVVLPAKRKAVAEVSYDPTLQAGLGERLLPGRAVNAGEALKYGASGAWSGGKGPIEVSTVPSTPEPSAFVYGAQAESGAAGGERRCATPTRVRDVSPAAHLLRTPPTGGARSSCYAVSPVPM
jgi:hypothetical protein